MGLDACLVTRPAIFPTASALPSAPRRADGVSVDLETALPPALEKVQSDQPVTALLAPTDPETAKAAVRTFIDAVVREDLQTLRGVLAADATGSLTTNSAASPLEGQWERRVRKLDYLALGAQPIFRESAVETYRYQDLDQLEGDRPAKPPALSSNDVVIRVPIDIRRVGTERLFGDEMIFVLRRADGLFKVRAIVEDFQAP